MTGAPSSPQRPKRQVNITWWALGLLAAVFLVVIITSEKPDSKPPSLCDMLRSGWTTDEIVDSDQWRDWPASMSRTERGMTVLREGERECPKLVGL